MLLVCGRTAGRGEYIFICDPSVRAGDYESCCVPYYGPLVPSSATCSLIPSAGRAGRKPSLQSFLFRSGIRKMGVHVPHTHPRLPISLSDPFRKHKTPSKSTASPSPVFFPALYQSILSIFDPLSNANEAVFWSSCWQGWLLGTKTRISGCVSAAADERTAEPSSRMQ